MKLFMNLRKKEEIKSRSHILNISCQSPQVKETGRIVLPNKFKFISGIESESLSCDGSWQDGSRAGERPDRKQKS